MLILYKNDLKELLLFNVNNLFVQYGWSIRQWSGRPGFNPRSSHTKDFKNGT